MPKEKQDTLAQALKLSEAIGQALKTDLWGKTRALKSIGNTLQQLYDQFTQLRTQTSTSEQSTKTATTQQEVFISLYQTQGNNLSKCQNILSNLNELSINRAIYLNESDVQASTPKGHASFCHAYAVVTINPDDILKPTHHSTDSNHRTLISIKEGVIKPDSIIRFVHTSGEYKWVNNFLVKQENTSTISNR